MGSLVFGDIKNHLELRIIDENNTETIMNDVFSANMEKHRESIISRYAIGSGLQSAVVDVSTYAGQGIPIKIKFILKGSGPIPTDRPDLLPDDSNRGSFPNKPGTSLLLDNIRLSGTGFLPAPIDLNTITMTLPLAGKSTISGLAGSVVSDGTIYAHGLVSGIRHETTAAADGSFSIDVPASSVQDTYYILYYSTPKTTIDNSSNRLFSPNITLKIPHE